MVGVDEAERNNLLHRAKAKCDLTIQRARDEYEAAKKSIEHVYALSNDQDLAATLSRQSEALLSRVAPVLGVSEDDRRGGPASRVRAIIADLDEFSTRTIVALSRSRDRGNALDTKQVSSVLNKFTETGEVVVVRRGSGRDPNVCRKATPAERAERHGQLEPPFQDTPPDEEVET